MIIHKFWFTNKTSITKHPISSIRVKFSCLKKNVVSLRWHCQCQWFYKINSNFYDRLKVLECQSGFKSIPASLETKPCMKNASYWGMKVKRFLKFSLSCPLGPQLLGGHNSFAGSNVWFSLFGSSLKSRGGLWGFGKSTWYDHGSTSEEVLPWYDQWAVRAPRCDPWARAVTEST